MPATTVVVVAPDAKLRASLEFLFRSEGLRVISRSDLSAEIEVPDSHDWCVVVDESAVQSTPDGWAHLALIRRPVILLVDQLRAVPEYYASTAIAKPLLGHNLVSAVMAATVH